MNHEQAIELCRIVYALCPGQRMNRDTPKAWAFVLNDVRFADAEQAVRTIYRDLGNDEEFGPRRIEPDDILRHVRKIRNDRIKHATEPIPPADLDEVQTITWLRAARRAIGDGQPVPDNGRQIGHRDIRPQLTAGIGLAGRRIDQDTQPTTTEEKQASLTTTKAETYPALTEQEFSEGCGYTHRSIPLCEDENARWVYAYGHRDPAEFALAVNEYDAEMQGLSADTVGEYVASDVQHVWAITVIPADQPDGWYIRWSFTGEITEHTPNRFPMSVISR